MCVVLILCLFYSYVNLFLMYEINYVYIFLIWCYLNWLCNIIEIIVDNL